MGGTSRFISLLTTPFPNLLHHHHHSHHLRRPLFLSRRLTSASRGLKVYTHTHLSPFSPIKSSPRKRHEFHAQSINNSAFSSSSSLASCFESHPWPEWCRLINVLADKERQLLLSSSGAVEDSFVAYEEVSDEFVRAASLCLAFAMENPNLIGSLSRKDIEVVVSNGTPFLFKAALETARRMRVFLGIGGSSDRDKASTLELMKYILSYASKPTVSSEKNTLYNRELIESSCRNLLHELVEVSHGAPAVDLPPPGHYQFSGGYGQTQTPVRQDIVMKRGDWICQKCDFMNFARNNKCLECEEPRPRRQLTGGEWECPQCDFFNYGKNVVCLRCDSRRPAETSLESTHSSLPTGYNGDSSYPNGIERRLAENEEKAQRWFTKISQMNNATDLDSAAADEDFPEIMPLRKGENKFVVSTRKTPLERRLANAQYKRNSGNNSFPEGNNILNTSTHQNMDQILGQSSFKSGTSNEGIAADENTETAIHHSRKSSEYAPFVPLPTDMFSKKNPTSRMDEKVEEEAAISHSPDANYRTSSVSANNDSGKSMEKLQSDGSESEGKEREQAEKSERWFKKISELHDVKDLPSAISDDDFPEIMPMRKGENRFVISKKKDRSLTSPMYKRQVAMEQASNSNFVPFVPFPPDYFAKKGTQQADVTASSTASAVETSSITSKSGQTASTYEPVANTSFKSANVEKIHQQSDDTVRKVADMNTAQTPDNQYTNSGYASTNLSGDQGVRHVGNVSGTSHASPSETSRLGSPRQPGNQDVRSGWTGKSLEGSAVKEPDPLDMSEEAKAERWFRRVAQIKDISELSQIPDEDFPSIMPMRKGVNRFVVSKRKTPLERRLTSTQYRRNLPVVSSDPIKRESDNSDVK